VGRFLVEPAGQEGRHLGVVDDRRRQQLAQIDDRVSLDAYHAEVETPSAATRTVVTFSEITFDRGLPDELFTQPAMEWGRYKP